MAQQQQQQQQQQRQLLEHILRLRAVERASGLKKSAIYEKIGNKEFPKPIPLGRRAVGWLESEIAAWQAARKAQRDSAAAA